MRLGYIRMVLQYLTGLEDHLRCVYGVFAWCFSMSHGKKIIIDAFRVVLQYLTGKEDHYRCG